MPGPPRPSFPSTPTEPGIRRLGVRSSAHLERPIRAQVILACAVALVLLAIPLYLMRSPSPETQEAPQQAPMGFSPTVPSPTPQDDPDGRVALGKVQRVRCSNSAVGVGQEGSLCDALPAVEAALSKAITETLDCAPRSEAQGTLNYVLKVDFPHKTLHVFPGASGSWKGLQARRATECVKQALSAPDWDNIEH